MAVNRTVNPRGFGTSPVARPAGLEGHLSNQRPHIENLAAGLSSLNAGLGSFLEARQKRRDEEDAARAFDDVQQGRVKEVAQVPLDASTIYWNVAHKALGEKAGYESIQKLQKLVAENANDPEFDFDAVREALLAEELGDLQDENVLRGFYDVFHGRSETLEANYRNLKTTQAMETTNDAFASNHYHNIQSLFELDPEEQLRHLVESDQQYNKDARSLPGMDPDTIAKQRIRSVRDLVEKTHNFSLFEALDGPDEGNGTALSSHVKYGEWVRTAKAEAAASLKAKTGNIATQLERELVERAKSGDLTHADVDRMEASGGFKRGLVMRLRNEVADRLDDLDEKHRLIGLYASTVSEEGTPSETELNEGSAEFRKTMYSAGEPPEVVEFSSAWHDARNAHIPTSSKRVAEGLLSDDPEMKRRARIYIQNLLSENKQLAMSSLGDAVVKRWRTITALERIVGPNITREMESEIALKLPEMRSDLQRNRENIRLVDKAIDKLDMDSSGATNVLDVRETLIELAGVSMATGRLTPEGAIDLARQIIEGDTAVIEEGAAVFRYDMKNVPPGFADESLRNMFKEEVVRPMLADMNMGLTGIGALDMDDVVMFPIPGNQHIGVYHRETGFPLGQVFDYRAWFQEKSALLQQEIEEDSRVSGAVAADRFNRLQEKRIAPRDPLDEVSP